MDEVERKRGSQVHDCGGAGELAFGVPAILLYLQGRLAPVILAVAMFDLLLGGVFASSFRQTRTGAERVRWTI